MSRNGTFIFNEMVAALDKFEDIIKDVVAPLVDRETPFIVSKSTKSRGRPKVRKQQKMSEKKKRMSQGKHKASKLVQGTLALVPNLHSMVNMLDKAYSNNDIEKKAQVLSERPVPKRKRTITGIFTEDECEADIRYIFPQWFVTKPQNLSRLPKNLIRVVRVGVRVALFGFNQIKDINAMDRWHRAMASILVVEDRVTWAVNTSVNIITMPTGFLDGLPNPQCEREQKMKGMLLRGSRSTVCGSLPYQSLLTLRLNLWIDDACMGHGLSSTPYFIGFQTGKVISKCGASNTANELVLLALHVDNNHWCGVAFDFCSESKAITLFDPLQAGKSKYYQMCDDIRQDLFSGVCTTMEVKKKTNSQ
ncbi:Cysteine protease [Phytophthora megakarya]|uniref:Cysteine protease n=1 Tax=Phytophthora megakarya TaxID=4795 RepID=A0A225W9B8_9STRA|nr:Cysteine protease [Phytophthora megakarya]